MSENLFSVAVNAPLETPLTYKAPKVSSNIVRGLPVKVPLGRRFVDAVVLNKVNEAPENFTLKGIQEVNSELPVLSEPFLRWIEWLSDYYFFPLGQTIQLAFPPLKRATKKRKSNKSPVVAEQELSSPPKLTDEQKVCFQNIAKHEEFSTHLLHGVTGSGKTEVYLQLLEQVLARGQQGLILVPEISLTPQLVCRFASRFPDQVAVIHSHLTEREKTDQWWESYEGRKKILIGARSALFCPIENLGIIIVDEEHESSFKQEEKLKYHARDAAIVRAKFLNIPCVLGSATPSLETWHNTQVGKYHLHQMKHRVSNRPMPSIEVINIKAERAKQEGEHLPFWMSPQLYSAMNDCLAHKKQAALFLNRRGVAHTVQCYDCGYVFECPNCAISLTLHSKKHLVCHYCNYTQTLKDLCPDCHSEKVSAHGLGTEQIEIDIRQLFPEARVARADRDEIVRREQLEELITNMESQEIDVLIGTQMIAKGLDFPGLDLVGLVLADVGFNLPDFRATEKSFQLLTQVSGRAGRHSQEPGKVIIQTLSPEQSSIIYTLNGDYEGFAQRELHFRKELHYPPFGRLASFRITGQSISTTEQAAEILRRRVVALIDHRTRYSQVEVLGPSPAPLAKIRNKFRYHLLLKSSNSQVLRSLVREAMTDQSKYPSGTKVQVDMDPIGML